MFLPPNPAPLLLLVRKLAQHKSAATSSLHQRTSALSGCCSLEPKQSEAFFKESWTSQLLPVKKSGFVEVSWGPDLGWLVHARDPVMQVPVFPSEDWQVALKGFRCVDEPCACWARVCIDACDVSVWPAELMGCPCPTQVCSNQ